MKKTLLILMFSLIFISNSLYSKDLGKGIKIGGTYRGNPMNIFSSNWTKYGNRWVKSGWLYNGSESGVSATFFKIDLSLNKTGVINFYGAGNPFHEVWLSTNSGFRKRGSSKIRKIDVWKFNW